MHSVLLIMETQACLFTTTLSRPHKPYIVSTEQFIQFASEPLFVEWIHQYTEANMNQFALTL